jgi:signal transduction histidine kinase
MIAMGAVLTLVMVVAFLVLLAHIGREQTANSASLLSDEAIATAFALESSVNDMHSAERGFVLAGRDVFLDPWRLARAAAPGQASRLPTLVAGDPGQSERAQDIRRRVGEWVTLSEQQVRLARADPEAARRRALSPLGETIVDGIRERLGRFREVEFALSEERRRRERDVNRDSVILGGGLLGGMALLVAAFVAYLSRRAVVPLRRITRAAQAVAEGNLGTRVDGSGLGEVGELGQRFNDMTSALSSARDELERKNVELSRRHDELESQRTTLQGVLAELAQEKEHVESFYRFGESLLREDALDRRAEVVLRSIADFSGSEVAVLYATTEEESPELRLVSTVGQPREVVAPILEPGNGPAGRAAEERRAVTVAHGDLGPEVLVLGRNAPVRHQLHVPLTVGTRLVGVLSLGRVADRAFGPPETEAILHLARQGATALVGVLALSWARRQATITRTVLDATPDGLALLDQDGTAVLVNPSMRRMLRSLRLPLDGSLWARMLAAADETADPEAFRESVRALAEDPEGELLDEFTVAGGGRTFQRYSAAVRQTDGSLLGRVLVLREITAEREAQRFKEDLVGLVSHELRTPITSISGYAHLSLSDTEEPLGERQRGYLEVVLRNAERLKRLFGDLLLLAQVDAGQLPLDVAPVDLVELVRERIEAASPDAATRGVGLEFSSEPVWAFLGDGTRLGQLVDNLVSNALKFTPSGGKVHVRLWASGARAVITVTDTGVGIPAGEIPRLFDRFYRASTARAVPGTGLGLAIAEAIVTAHGGTIDVESAPGSGTTVRVELPATPAVAPALSAGQPSGR